MKRRLLALTALTLVALSSVMGAGSVSSVSADRDVSVAVVEDEEAYLGIEFGDTDWPNRTRTLTFANRVSVPLEVSISGDIVTISPGELAALAVDCGDVDIAAVGEDIRIDATRTVTCEHPGGGPPDDRTNNGQCSNSGEHGQSGESGNCGGSDGNHDDSDESVGESDDSEDSDESGDTDHDDADAD